MAGYLGFIIFCAVFGSVYLCRDKSKDKEKTDSFYRH